ncbi:MAG: hypothetical protein ACKOTD_04330 [Phycisphaerales bacterium]
MDPASPAARAALGRILGAVMTLAGGTADPKTVNARIMQRLSGGG